MSLFAGLFSPKAPERQLGRKEIVVLFGVGKFDMEIIEEGRFQAALEAICGKRMPQGVNRLETALLIQENKHSRVRVEIRGRQVGYLTPKAAVLYRQELAGRGKPEAVGQCQAVIRGGWLSSDGRKGDYEVWLDMPPWSQ